MMLDVEGAVESAAALAEQTSSGELRLGLTPMRWVCESRGQDNCGSVRELIMKQFRVFL